MEAQDMFAENQNTSMHQIRDSSIMSKSTNDKHTSITSGRSHAQLYESITIKKQYAEYSVLKNDTLRYAKYVV